MAWTTAQPPASGDPRALRPREKLHALGVERLADAELVALLMRTGMPGCNVVAFAQALLDAAGGLAALFHADAASLPSVKGFGPAKQAEWLAVRELARRALTSQATQRPIADNPRAMAALAQCHLARAPREVFAVAFLDARLALIAWEDLFHGTLNEAVVWPREVVRRALARGAAAVVLAHNHPSGNAEPSVADQRLTARVKAALATVDIQVVDHLVVGDGQVVSMAARGMV